VNARPSTSGVPSDHSFVSDEFTRQLPGLGIGALRLLLRALQERLGTAGEQPGDVERARLLGHEINHRTTAVQLERDLARLDAASAPSTPAS
jgi:hypothetical protein